MLRAKIEAERDDLATTPGESAKVTLILTRAEFAVLVAAVDLANSCSVFGTEQVYGVPEANAYRAAKRSQ